MFALQGTRRFGSEEAPPIDWIVPPSRRAGAYTDAALSEMFAYHATTMANTVHAPLLVFSRQGNMPALLSHYRPDYCVFAFTGMYTLQLSCTLSFHLTLCGQVCRGWEASLCITVPDHHPTLCGCLVPPCTDAAQVKANLFHQNS